MIQFKLKLECGDFIGKFIIFLRYKNYLNTSNSLIEFTYKRDEVMGNIFTPILKLLSFR